MEPVRQIFEKSVTTRLSIDQAVDVLHQAIEDSLAKHEAARNGEVRRLQVELARTKEMLTLATNKLAEKIRLETSLKALLKVKE